MGHEMTRRLFTTYEYDAAGRRTKRTLENNTFTVYDYDNADQLTNIWHRQTSGGVTNTVSQYQYGYDDAGNRTNMVGMSGSLVRSESYNYDAMDQLTGVTYKTGGVTNRTVSYQYDAAGNRTNLVEKIGNATNTTSYAANSDNQLTSASATRQGLTVTGVVDPGESSNKWYNSTAASRGVSAGVSQTNGTFSIPGVPVTGGANALTVTVTDVSGNIATQVVSVTVATNATALAYDGNGNQTNDAVWSYSYDRENRLVSATSASLAVNYSYDSLGRLIERRTSGATTTTNRLYYAGWQLVAEYNGADTLQRKYVYGPGIDEPIRMTTGSTNYYYHADGLGSVAQISDATGALVEQYTYDVYGTSTIYSGSGVVTNSSAIGNRLMFTARDHDPDTGWYNYRRRYYNPSTGRFVQPDPIGMFGGDVNLYRYCLNSCPNFTDPDGLVRGEVNSYRQMIGGGIAVGFWDAWRTGPGEIGQQAFLLSNSFALTQPRLPCESLGSLGSSLGSLGSLGSTLHGVVGVIVGVVGVNSPGRWGQLSRWSSLGSTLHSRWGTVVGVTVVGVNSPQLTDKRRWR